VLAEMLHESLPSRPSFLRAMLQHGPDSLLRAMMQPRFNVLRHLCAPQQLPATFRRLASATPAHQRPALAELLWGGGCGSLMCALAANDPDSVLRALLTPPAEDEPSVLELFVRSPLLDLVLLGEEDAEETCLLRDALTRPDRLWGRSLTLAQMGVAGEFDMVRLCVRACGRGRIG
jgi:hypothetical protein